MDYPGGTPSLLGDDDLSGAEPVWSPDGRCIAYVTFEPSSGGAIWKIPAEGGTPVRLTTDEAQYREVVWSPDGSRLLAIRARLDPTRRWTPRETGSRSLVYVPAVRLEHLNAQGQPQFVWPPSFALARAYVDQLARSHTSCP